MKRNGGSAVAGGSSFEAEWILVSKPSGEFRLQLFPQIRTHIQIGDARASAQPLQNAAAGKVDIQRLHIDRNGAQRLKSIEHDVRADFVGLLDDGLRILNVRAAEDHVRYRDQQSLFVDRVQQALDGNRDSVVGLNHVHAGAVGLLRLPEIHHRREIHVAVDDFVALAGEIEARSHDRLAGGDVLMGRNRALRGVHQRANLVADLRRPASTSVLPRPARRAWPRCRRSLSWRRKRLAAWRPANC